jgi:hypothetical protein
MPCFQQSADKYLGLHKRTTSGGYVTEADCLQACKEGACCEGTTCSIKPQCQCQGTGKVFKGVGTTCGPNPCNLCDLTSISIGTQGTASGFYQSAVQSFECPSAAYSSSVSGGGTLARNDGYLGSLACSVSSGSAKCAFSGTYTAAGGATVTATVVFFADGANARFSARIDVRTTGTAAYQACDRTGLQPGNIGWTGGAVCDIRRAAGRLVLFSKTAD